MSAGSHVESALISMARSSERSLEEEKPKLLEKEPTRGHESQATAPRKERSYVAGCDAKPWSQETKDSAVRNGQGLRTDVKRNWKYFVLSCIMTGATILFGFFLAGKLHRSRSSEVDY